MATKLDKIIRHLRGERVKQTRLQKERRKALRDAKKTVA
jgi:hypothetical protein